MDGKDYDKTYPTPPSQTKSEAIIAEKAPAAVRVLQRLDATDLYEALGLSNYALEEMRNG